MTVTDFCEYVRNIHNAIQDDHFSDIEIYKYLEAAANEAAELGVIEGTDTTASVAGTSIINYPANATFIRRILYAGKPMKYLTFRQFESRQPTGVSVSGTPREYALWNNQIWMTPTPSTSAETITIYSEKMQSSITTALSTIDLPSILHPRLSSKVVSLMYDKDENPAAAARFEARWENVDKPAMIRYIAKRRRTNAPVVVVDSDSSLETEFGVV